MLDYYNQVTDDNIDIDLAPKLGEEAPSIAPEEWKNVPTLSELKEDLTGAESDHSTEVSKVEVYLDNMNLTGTAKVKTGVGKSSVQPKVIRKQAEWRYPALSEPFLSTEDLFNARGITASDKTAARQQQLVLNDQFNNKIDKIKFISDYVRTGVDEGTIICRTGWFSQEITETYQEPLYDLVVDPEMEEAYARMAYMEKQDPVLFQEQFPTHVINAYEQSVADGQMYRPVKTDNTEEVTKSRMLHNHPTVDVCRTQDVIFDPTCQGDFEKAKFVIYKFETSKSELLATGIYSNLEYVNSDTAPIGSISDAEVEKNSFTFKDQPRQRIDAYEYWGEWDIDNTGVTKPVVITWIGDTIIRMEENPFPDKKPPFIIIPYLPVRKSLYGEPDGALIEDTQKITGAITRGMIDIMARSANGQVAYRKDALDPIQRRKFDRGDDYEFQPHVDPRTAFYTHTYPEIPSSAQYLLASQGAETESLTGVKAFNDGLSGSALGDTATGIRGALTAASKRELGILRRLADGIVKIGYKFSAMNAEFLSEEEVVRVTEESFETIKRDDLAGRIDIKLSISTAEEDEAKAQEIAFQLQTMASTLPFELTQILLADSMRLRKMPDVAKAIEDYQPQPDPIEQEIKMLELEKLKREIAEIEARTIKQFSQAELDEARAENLGADTDTKNLNYVEQESGVTQARAKETAASQAEAQTKKSIIESRLPKQSS